jgi:putative SOS response-associated peptidase YedK
LPQAELFGCNRNHLIYSMTNCDPAPVQRAQQQRRQSAVDARHLPGLSGADRAQCRRRPRDRDGALGMPSSQQALLDATKKRAEMLQGKGKTADFKELLRTEPDSGTTNIRNVSSAHWKRWLGLENRCLVPFTSFSEYDIIDGKKTPVWFAPDATRPLLAFAGLWTNWTSVRKAKEGEIAADIYAFLTTEPNAEVKRVHPKAMPVILTTAEEHDVWMRASLGRSQGAAATATGRGAEDRRHRREGRPRPGCVVDYCGTPSTAKTRKLPHFSPMVRAAVYSGECRHFIIDRVNPSGLSTTRPFGGSPSIEAAPAR